MTNVMTLISTLSIFHSCEIKYQLAPPMVFTSRSSLDMENAAHTMMIPYIAIKRQLKVSEGYRYQHLRNSFKSFMAHIKISLKNIKGQGSETVRTHSLLIPNSNELSVFDFLNFGLVDWIVSSSD